MEETLAGMNRIREQMEFIAGSIVRLSEQSQAIGEIIATVNDLAEQSNLLAVNAAIEAAKAGEQGKGFAVVAQEVKSLAEQSKQATAQVRGILGDVQKATSAAVMATEQGSKVVEAGVKQSAEVNEAIRQLGESIAEAAQASTQIAASSQQQVVGMDQVAQAMESIKVASAQNVAGTKQAEAAAQQLHEPGREAETTRGAVPFGGCTGMPGPDKEFQQRLLATFRGEAEEHVRAISRGLIDLENSRGWRSARRSWRRSFGKPTASRAPPGRST